MGTNDRYTTFAASLDGDPRRYVGDAADIGQFNNPGGEFAAFVTFTLGGQIQDPTDGAGPAAFQNYLWGNRGNTLNSAGWDLRIGYDTTPAVAITVEARLGTGAAETILQAPLNLRQIPTAFIERLMTLALWYDGTNAALTLNGVMIVNPTAAAIAASPDAPHVGEDPDGQVDAKSARILSCGYTNFSPGALTNNPTNIGTLAGTHFQACQSAPERALLDDILVFDWQHRYVARDLVPLGTSGAILRTPDGTAARVASIARGAAIWPDVGGLNAAGVIVPAGATPAPLAAPDPQDTPTILTKKNLEWVDGGFFQPLDTP